MGGGSSVSESDKEGGGPSSSSSCGDTLDAEQRDDESTAEDGSLEVEAAVKAVGAEERRDDGEGISIGTGTKAGDDEIGILLRVFLCRVSLDVTEEVAIGVFSV